MHKLKQILQFGEKIIVTATFVIVIIIAIVFILNGSRVKTHLFQFSHYFTRLCSTPMMFIMI